MPTDHEPAADASGRLPYTTTSGALLAAVAVPWAVVGWPATDAAGGSSHWAMVLAWLATAALGTAGLMITGRPRVGRVLGTIGVLLLPALAWPQAMASPALTLLLVLAALVAAGSMWQLGTPLFQGRRRRRTPALGRMRGAAAAAFGTWLITGLSGGHVRPHATLATGAAMLLAVGLGLIWLLPRYRTQRGGLVLAAMLVAAVLATTTEGGGWSLVSCGAVYTLVVLLFGPRAEPRRPDEHWWTALLDHPERMLVTTFAAMAAVGAVVLALPQSSRAGTGLATIDAAFTAVSAVCVTGLAVRDTAREFSGLGEVTLLLLMQLGGLGIMTFSTAALRVLGGRMSMRREAAVARLIGTRDRGRLITSAQDILRVTFVCEAVGALVLAILFVRHGDGVGQACWRGVFTAVSAFCNAGFALQSDSLAGFREVPSVLHTVGALIVLGGLSPALVLALARRDRRQLRSLQMRLCLLVPIALLLLGFVLFLASEWNHSLHGLSVSDRMHNAWFQSVTLRTAGFNSVDLAAVHPATYVLMLGMMFVGGNPGGTAGGVKTTTVAVLALSVVHTIRGAAQLTVGRRSIPDRTVQRAAVIVTVAVAGAMLATWAVLLTQRLPLTVALFEVVSALGTVGLSQGGTAMLDDVGKVIILACMFVGRIGGLSIMMFMSQRANHTHIRYPQDDVDVG